MTEKVFVVSDEDMEKLKNDPVAKAYENIAKARVDLEPSKSMTREELLFEELKQSKALVDDLLVQLELKSLWLKNREKELYKYQSLYYQTEEGKAANKLAAQKLFEENRKKYGAI